MLLIRERAQCAAPSHGLATVRLYAILKLNTATLPEDALTVCVVEHAEFRFNKASFDTLWSILGGSFTYSGKEFPEYMLEDSEKKANPPENQEFQAELKIFNQSYASAEIHSDESAKVMEADMSPEEYNVKDLVTVFIFLTLFSASATAALWILRLDRVVADRKMSLNELSARVGVANVNLSKMKNGHISAIRFSTLAAICDVLKCQPGDILEYSPEEKNN